jgi:hypothetical protein
MVLSILLMLVIKMFIFFACLFGHSRRQGVNPFNPGRKCSLRRNTGSLDCQVILCHRSQSWIVELVCFPESQNISTFGCKLCIQISRFNDQYLLYSVSTILAVLLRFKYLATMDSSLILINCLVMCHFRLPFVLIKSKCFQK